MDKSHIGDVGDGVAINQGNGYQHVDRSVTIAAGNVFPRSIQDKSMIVNYTYVVLFFMFWTMLYWPSFSYLVYLTGYVSRYFSIVLSFPFFVGAVHMTAYTFKFLMLKNGSFHIKFSETGLYFKGNFYSFDSEIWNIKRILWSASTLKFFTHKDDKLDMLVIKFINESEAQYVYDWFFSKTNIIMKKGI